jgi:aminoacyl tRNA synthase complex-interacting multifunctional protein 1
VCQDVSGLEKYYSLNDLVIRRVFWIRIVKPGKFRDVRPAGLVVCASSGDHTTIESLILTLGVLCNHKSKGWNGQL